MPEHDRSCKPEREGTAEEDQEIVVQHLLRSGLVLTTVRTDKLTRALCWTICMISDLRREYSCSEALPRIRH